MKILAHTSFIGTTGYNNHSRSFFCALNKYHTVKVRNLTVGDTWKGMSKTPHDNEPYITQEMKDMLILQTLTNSDGTRSDYPIYNGDYNFKPDVHIVLNDTNNYYFYDEYKGYKIGFCVYESTRYPDNFFNQLLKFDEMWVPTQWQFDSLVEQGYPIEKIHIVTEGVDVDVFKPSMDVKKHEKFRFLYFGRWDYRKATTEVLRTFGETFKGNNNVELVCSVENRFPTDETRSTEDRIKKYDIHYDNIKFIKFVSREDYVKYLQEGDVFVSCARSEGWNLPLCIPEGKLIFSNGIFIPIENIKKNDMVITHNSKEQKVIEVFKRRYNDNIIRISLYGNFEVLELTPEHPIYTIRREKFITKKGKFNNIPNIKPDWIKSKNIKKGDIILRATLPQKYFNDEIFDLLSLDNSLLYNNNNVWYKTGFNYKSEQIKYKRYVNLWDLSYLFGWYIAEGTDGLSKLIFTLNAKKEIYVAEKIISEMKKIFNATGSYKIKNNTLRLTFNSVLLCKFFTNFCGKLSYNKKIPEKFLLGPSDKLEELITNMIIGDGFFSDKTQTYNYTTVSKILANQLIFGNQRLNKKTNLQLSKRKRIDKHPCYILTWNKNNENGRHSNKSWWHTEGLGILVKNVNSENYNGYVYNLEAENDNSYLLSNATVHNCEAMSCGIPSIYSNWGGQLQFARNKGIPVKIINLRSANIGDKEVGGEYCEPDFDDLAVQMKNAYENYESYKIKSLAEAELIHKEFTWDNVAKKASKILEKKEDSFIFVTAGDILYLPTIQKLVESINEFSKNRIIVYGVNCDVPFDSPNMIKKRIDPPFFSEYDRWYWKHYACIASLNEEYENFVWIDGDAIVNYNIDTIEKYFRQIENYPLSDIHVQEEFYGVYQENGENKTQYFSERLADLWSVQRSQPYMHVCLFVYNKKCKWWFEELIENYKSIDLKDYRKYLLWNDETIDNVMRWKYGFKKHLPLSNFDTSSYDGDIGFTKETLNHFYKFWNEPGPQNFNRIFGYQFIPEDKSNIVWFHGNKNMEMSDKMIEFIKLKRDNNFHQSKCFYTDVYKLDNFEKIYDIPGTTIEIASKYGWPSALFHEIYNLKDYYHNREKKIHEGDIVVDVGANIGVFTRWAYMEGARKVISFEPDHRYFQLLKLNSSPDTILFNAAVSNSIGTIRLYESPHLGGSNILHPDTGDSYPVRTYTIDYLFETGLVTKIDFLKVDIEGAEHQLFSGVSDQNLMKIRTIAMEYHHAHVGYDEELRTNLIKRLNKIGFNSYLLFLGTDNALQMIYFWR